MSKSSVITASLAAALLLSVTLVRSEEEKKDKYKPLCPVSGKPAVETSALDYKGAHVYFCCNNCPKAFEKDAKKFAVKANAQLVGTGQAKAVKCPLTGRDINPDTAVEVAGIKVAFCCNNCKGKVEKAEGDEQLALVFSDAAFAKGFKVPEKKAE